LQPSGLAPIPHTLQSVRMPAAPESPKDLRPTLWRTCRTLANRQRLRMIELLLSEPDQPVSKVAESLGMSTGTASQYLRLLNSRGLLRATRVSRWVVYRLAANDSIPGTGELLGALESTFKRARDPIETVFRLATAFTHPRRIEIVRALGDTTLGLVELKRRTGISSEALQRHLGKLEERGVIARQPKGTGKAYRLGRRPSRLGRLLIQLARQS